jgi:predicted PurR-regulated permease PerM
LLLWRQPALGVGLFVVLELSSNLVIEPWAFGQSIGVSQAAILVATAFWAWLWGPVGLMLAAPRCTLLPRGPPPPSRPDHVFSES